MIIDRNKFLTAVFAMTFAGACSSDPPPAAEEPVPEQTVGAEEPAAPIPPPEAPAPAVEPVPEVQPAGPTPE
jgi:hypothetical protein